MTSPFSFSSEDPFKKLERIRNMGLARIAKASAESISDRAAQQPLVQIDPNTLTPQMTGAPQPEGGGRKGFFERLQSFAEFVPGSLLAGTVKLIPGEQGTFEKNLNQAAQDLQTSHGQPTNPWQSIRRKGMENTEAWRRTDMPSVNLDVNPFGPINLPGDRTFDRVDFGVKGAAELLSDPLNYIPIFGWAAKGTKATAKGLKAAGAGTVVEAISSSKNAAIDLTQSYKNIIKPRTDLPIPAGTVAERVRQRQSVMSEAEGPLNSIEHDGIVNELRVFRGISGTGDPLDPASGIVGKKGVFHDESELVAGPGIYVSRSPYISEGFSEGYKKGKVQEYELDLYTNDQYMYEGILPLHENVGLFEATQPSLFRQLDEDFDSLWFSGIGRAKDSDVGDWFFNVQGKYSESELGALRIKRDAGEITEKQYAKQAQEAVAAGQKEFNEDLLKAGVKVIDNSVADAEKELIVLDKFILKPVESRRVSFVPEVHMRPDAQEIVEGMVDAASTELPSWFQKVKNGNILPGMEGLPPLRWAFSKINPLAFLPTGGDSVSRARSLALTSHQIRQARDGGRVLHSVTNLSAINGYSKTKDGLFGSRNFSGVFEVEEGFIKNVLDANDEYVVWATKGRDMNKNNMYALFEGAFDESYGLDFSKKFKGEIQPGLKLKNLLAKAGGQRGFKVTDEGKVDDFGSKMFTVSNDGSTAQAMVLLPDENGKVIGSITGFETNPKLRRQGFGEALVIDAMEELQKRGATSFEVYAETNAWNKVTKSREKGFSPKLFGKLGFTETGVRNKFGDREMVLDLTGTASNPPVPTKRATDMNEAMRVLAVNEKLSSEQLELLSTHGSFDMDSIRKAQLTAKAPTTPPKSTVATRQVTPQQGEGLITELTDESIEELISKGLSRDFVDQAFAIKQIQDWAEDAKMLLKERGVPVQEVYGEDSAWSYIFRQAVSIEGRDLSGRGKIAGSVPTYGKDRSYVGEDILDSLFTRNVKYRDNFLVAGTDFMDSVYKSVRDTDFHNSLKKVGVEFRKEHLEAPQNAFKAAARNRQLAETSIGQVRKLQSEAKGVKTTKILTPLSNEARQNLGFDATNMQAEDVLQTQRDAVGKAVATANELAKEARDIQVAVNKLTNQSAWNFLHRIGVGGTDEAITDLGSTFGSKYPELASELNKLKGLDTRVKQNTPVTETRAVGVPVTAKTVKPAHTYKTDIWGNRVIDEPYTQPWVSYTKMRDSVSKQISNMKKQVDVPGGTKPFLPRNSFAIETYAVKDKSFSYIVENIKTGSGRTTNKWNVYIRAGSKKGEQINSSPLLFDDLKGIDELSPVIASDTAGRRGFQPSYIPREGEAYKVTQRQMKVQTNLGDPKAQAAFEKARKLLAEAINKDTGAKVRNARRAKGEVKLFKAQGGFTGRQRDWIKEEFPALFNELQAAVDIDVPGIRRERLRKVEVALKEELKILKAIEKTKKVLLKKERQRFGGPVTVTKESLEKRQTEVFGGRVKTGAYNEFTGKHALEIVEGESHARLTKAGEAIIIREAKKDKLQFLKGLYFREEDVVAIEKALLPFDTSGGIIGRTQSFFLRDVPAAGDIARVLKAGFDFGAPFLQGIPLLARRPDIWAKATIRHYKIAAQGRGFHQAYLQKNIDVVREMVELDIPLGAGATDYFNALHRGGAMEQLGGFINTKLGVDAAIAGDSRLAKKAGQSVKGTGEKFMSVGKTFEESFEGFNDYARIEMFKALRNTAAKSEGGMQDLGAFIRNMTGALDSTMLGVSQSQQAFERGWMFFSPRYTRASLALMADAFQGGLRGQQARQTFVQMATGGAVAYMAFARALGQPIKLDPRPVGEGGDGAKFMTVEINGQNVGIGGFWTSMIRLIANTATWDVDSPSALIKPSTRDNPIARWLRSRSAPTTGLATDWWNGANFLGESIEGAGGWSQHILKQTLPFTIENAVFEDGPIFGRLTAGVPAEFAGGRTFPVSAFEYRNLERERAAQARFGTDWDGLNGLQKDSLENDPKGDLGRFTEVVRNEATKVQPADPRGAEQALNDYFEARRKAEMTWRSTIREGVHLFENGDNAGINIDTVVFKERYLEPANAKRRTELELQREDESYLEVEKYFSELSEKNGPLLPEDEAFGEYIKKIVAADFSHPVVGFDFRAKDKAEADFGLHYGQETLQYVKDRFTAARESYDFQFPALIDELYVGRSKFEYYFRDTEGEVLSRVENPEYVKEQYERYIYMSELNREVLKENVPELKSFLSILEKTRRALRENNAELDAFMYRWGFAGTLAHEVNDFVDAKVWYRTHPATTFPYPVPEN